MRRRDLIAILGGVAAAWPLAARAQEGTVLIGFLSTGSSNACEDFLASFRKGLEVLGYIEGRNIVIESRWANGRSE
jgi:putative ABC transport system substrate-binding protein